MNILFFGSTTDSVIVLSRLFELRMTNYPSTKLRTGELRISAVVTQPPKPVGRSGTLEPTPVEIWAKKHQLKTISFPTNTEKPWLFADETHVIQSLTAMKPDLLVSASYGQKIPIKIIKNATFGGLNVHPSLLPRWRGADPVPWAIIAGDTHSGVSITALTDKLDIGTILVQQKISITSQDSSDPLRTKLFTIGADLLRDLLTNLSKSSVKHIGLPAHSGKSETDTMYARKFNREDGYVPWNILKKALTESSYRDIEEFNNLPVVTSLRDQKVKLKKNESIGVILDRFIRALSPWPGVWTIVTIREGSNGIPMEKRLKILASHVQPMTHLLEIDSVQLEGKKPVPYSQFQAAYLS